MTLEEIEVPGMPYHVRSAYPRNETLRTRTRDTPAQLSPSTKRVKEMQDEYQAFVDRFTLERAQESDEK